MASNSSYKPVSQGRRFPWLALVVAAILLVGTFRSGAAAAMLMGRFLVPIAAVYIVYKLVSSLFGRLLGGSRVQQSPRIDLKPDVIQICERCGHERQPNHRC